MDTAEKRTSASSEASNSTPPGPPTTAQPTETVDLASVPATGLPIPQFNFIPPPDNEFIQSGLIPTADHVVDMTGLGYQRRDQEKFCSEQVRIPPKLPNILKTFTKSAMRTQPRDLLQWAGAYFKALSEGQVPPAKDTLEYPQQESKDGLTVGYLRVLHKQVGGRDINNFSKLKVNLEEFGKKWIGLCFSPRALEDVLKAGRMAGFAEVEWKKLLGLLAGTIGKNLLETMKVVCEVLTEQPDGVDAMIPYAQFWEIYLFLAKLDGCITREQVDAVNEFLMAKSKPNFCLVGPKDFLDPKCPPLY